MSNTLKAYDMLGLADEGNPTCKEWADGMRTAMLSNRNLITDVDWPAGGSPPDLADLEARVAALEAAGSGWLQPTGGDDTALLQAAIVEEEAKGWGGVLRLQGVFKVSDTLTIRRCHVDAAHARLETTAPVGIIVDTFPGSYDRYTYGSYQLALPRVINVASEYWVPAAETVGIKVVSSNFSLITVDADSWDVALLLAPESSGVAYNTFHVKRLTGRVACRLMPRHSGDVFGWANQNTFIGGSYAWLRDPTDREHAIHIGSAPDVKSIPNNNVWVNPSVEGFDVAIDSGGSHDVFIAPRLETVSPTFRFRGYAHNNIVVGGYGAQNWDIDESAVLPQYRGLNGFVNGWTV